MSYRQKLCGRVRRRRLRIRRHAESRRVRPGIRCRRPVPQTPFLPIVCVKTGWSVVTGTACTGSRRTFHAHARARETDHSGFLTISHRGCAPAVASCNRGPWPTHVSLNGKCAFQATGTIGRDQSKHLVELSAGSGMRRLASRTRPANAMDDTEPKSVIEELRHVFLAD